MKAAIFLFVLLAFYKINAQASFESLVKLGAANGGDLEGINYTASFQKVTESQLIYGIQAQVLDADFKDSSLNMYSVFGTFGFQSRTGESTAYQGSIGAGPSILNAENKDSNLTVLSATINNRFIKEFNKHFRIGLDVSFLINKELATSDVGLFIGYVF